MATVIEVRVRSAAAERVPAAAELGASLRAALAAPWARLAAALRDTLPGAAR